MGEHPDTMAEEDNEHIHSLRENKELLQVADLMEVCFGKQLDRDGKEYIKQMRRMALDAQSPGWLSGATELVNIPMGGFVWKESDKIVGNLTMIPYRQGKRQIILIANVAVHPDFRRKGIARQLTEKALSFSQEQNVKSIWLQVRDDNPGAESLYRGLGFVERSRRTMWQTQERYFRGGSVENGLEIRSRSAKDWTRQQQWLCDIYPAEIAWYLPLNLKRLDDKPLRNILRWLDGTSARHWSAYWNDELVGVLSWEPSRSYTDYLWLATTAEWETKALHSLLPFVRREISSTKPQSINYPAGRCDDIFTGSGFDALHTLVWMSIEY